MEENILSDGQKRSKNFKDSEVTILLDLVSHFKDILECKKSDQLTLKEKDEVWRNVEKNFNQRSGVFHRDWKTLKVKYENIKKSSKKKLAENKMYILGTGGGPYKSPPVITLVDTKVKEILGDLPVFGMTSKFDNDADFPSSIIDQMPVVCEDEVGFEIPCSQQGTLGNSPIKNVDHPNEVKVLGKERSCDSVNIKPKGQPFLPPRQMSDVFVSSPVKINNNEETPDEPCGFSKNFSVAHLRSQKSSSLLVRKKKRTIMDSSRVGQKIEQVSKAKEELIELQKKVYEDQIKIQKEEHEMKMELLREEKRLVQLKIKSEELKIARGLKDQRL